MNKKGSEENLVRLTDPKTAGNELTPSTGTPGNIIQLGNEEIDMTGLTTEQQQQLKIKHAEASIDVNQKKQELIADAGALNHALGTMSHHTEAMAEAGQHVTITHTQDSSLGRTEIIMGTSDAAKKGKLTRTQTGQQVDQTYVFAGVAIFIVIVIALLMVAMSR